MLFPLLSQKAIGYNIGPLEFFFSDLKSTNSLNSFVGKNLLERGAFWTVIKINLYPIYLYNFFEVTFSNSVIVNSWPNQIARFDYAAILNYCRPLMFNVMDYMK